LFIPAIKMKRGSIACLQNLLPDASDFPQISDIYCHGSGFATVEYLDLTYLKNILRNDDTKLLKLWSILTYRLIMIYHEKLPEFKVLTKEKIRMFVKMCTVVKYRPGDTIDLSSGGICFKGGFKELGNDITEAENAL
jgi:hypothetical protein